MSGCQITEQLNIQINGLSLKTQADLLGNKNLFTTKC